MKLEIKTFEVGKRPIKMLIYGKHKIGKTTLASTAPNPLFLSSEPEGLGSIANKSPSVVEVETYDDVMEVINWFKRGDKRIAGFETLVIDSLTQIGETIEEDLKRQKENRALRQNDWGVYKDRLQILIRELAYKVPVNVVVIAHEEIVMDGENIDLIRPMISGQMKNKIGMYFSILCYLSSDIRGTRTAIVRNSTKYDVGCWYDAITPKLSLDLTVWFNEINKGKKEAPKPEPKKEQPKKENKIVLSKNEIEIIQNGNITDFGNMLDEKKSRRYNWLVIRSLAKLLEIDPEIFAFEMYPQYKKIGDFELYDLFETALELKGTLISKQEDKMDEAEQSTNAGAGEQEQMEMDTTGSKTWAVKDK